MNLITRTIPALFLGLSSLTLSTGSQADSSFSITIAGGYPVSHATYSYYDYDRPYARTHHRHYRSHGHRGHKNYKHRRHHGHHHKNSDRYGYYGHHNAHKDYDHYGRPKHHHTKKQHRNRGRDDHRARNYGDKRKRRHQTSHARTGYY
jgi:hypothetical protein